MLPRSTATSNRDRSPGDASTPEPRGGREPPRQGMNAEGGGGMHSGVVLASALMR